MRSVVVAFAACVCLAYVLDQYGVAAAESVEETKLDKWLKLDRVLQDRLYRRMEVSEEHHSERHISAAWNAVRNDVCLKGSATLLVNVRNARGCGDVDVARKAARRACKAAGIMPGDLLLPNCTAALAKACPKFFDVPGLATKALCDAVGLDRVVPRVKAPQGSKASPPSNDRAEEL